MTAELKPYPTMKDSGLPWAPEIPSHWELKPNREFLRVKKTLVGDQHPEYTLLSLTKQGVIIRDLTDNRGKFSTDMGTSQKVQRGDLIMCLFDVPETPRTVGLSQYDGMITGAYTVFDVCSDELAKWFEMFYLAMDDQKALSPLYSGLRNTIQKPRFLGTKTPIPPPDERVAIVRYLNYVNVRVRRLTEAKRKLIGLLTEYKQAIIHRAVTRGLDPNVPLKDSGIEWLGMIPQHWEVRRFKTEVANIIDQTDRRDEDDEYIALEHVESWTGKIYPAPPDMSFDSQVKKFEPGDVLFGKLRPYLAKVARPKRKGVCVSEFFVFRPRNGKLSAGYLEQFLRSSSVIGVINSSTFGAKMPRTDWKFVGNLSQLIPPISEQVAIVEYLDRATTEIDIAADRAERQIELLNEYRTRLIADVVTGKLDVRDAALDPEERDR